MADLVHFGKASTSSIELLELHDRYRGKIEHEDSLINWRTTWLIAFSSVLLIVVANLTGNVEGLQLKIASFTLGAVGMILAGTTLVSVLAAREAIQDHVNAWDRIVCEHGDGSLPRIAGSKRGKGIIGRGGVSSICLPIAMFGAWVSLLFAILVFETPMTEMREVIERADEVLAE